MTRENAVDHDPEQDDDLVPELPDEESLTTSLRRALESTPRLPRDRAGIRLAMNYAATLDDLFDRLDEIGEHRDDDDRDTTVADINRLTGLIAKIGPRYEATLEKLGMFPGARPATRTGEPAGGQSPEAALLAFLQRGLTPPGVDPAAAVDPAVTEADSGD